MDIKTWWYKLSPYHYIIIGLISTALSSTNLAMIYGCLLLTAAGMIERMR